jgi:NhaA family Na+:H+ antiporter
LAQSVDSSKGVATRPFSPLKAFLKAETSSAAVLALGAAVALIWANSPFGSSYVALWSHEVGFSVGDWTFVLDVRHWINDGLMTIFFLVVGLEIKRELTQGHLSNLRAALLPCIAAMGGMLTPAVIYLAIAGSVEPRGWAIPVATDIALAVGALSVVGRRVPTSGRVFLLALAIVDDIGAIAIIAIAYSKGLSPSWFILALAAVITTVVLQRTSVQSVAPYALVGACMWFGLYQAGVHPTIAGVVMGLMTPSVPRRQIRVVEDNGDSGAIHKPMNSTDGESEGGVSVIDWLQHALHPWTSLLIVPIFALANSGVEITSDGLRGAVQSPITWGIFFGLFIGKPLGITVTTWLAVRSGAADVPAGASKKQVVGIGSAAGIGFTVAMFITELALQGETDVANAKLAILAASVLSAVTSITLLKAGRK